MTNITIPLPDDLIDFLDTMVHTHRADSRAGLVRRILSERRDTELLSLLRDARAEYKKGEYYEGDVRTLVKKLKAGK